MLNNLFVILTVVIFLPTILKLINMIRILIESISDSEKSFSLSEVLNRLTFKEYRLWCIDYLLSLGYHDIMFTTESEADLICKLDDDIYLVKCLRSTGNLSLEDVQLLLGTMVSEDIFKGIIITTSKVNLAIENYLESMSDEYIIEVISKDELKDQYDEPVSIVE